jgi:hypothetical protein
VAQTFFLDSAVKSLNVGIVIRSTKPAMSSEGTISFEGLLKIAAILRAIVGLHQAKVKAKPVTSPTYDPGGNTGTDLAVNLGIGHPGVEINDRVDIPPSFGEQVNIVNGVSLD